MQTTTTETTASLSTTSQSTTTYPPTTTTDPPTTVPLIPTTVPVVPTTVPVIPTTVPIEPTTVPLEPTTVPLEPTTVPLEPTTVPIIPTTVPLITTTMDYCNDIEYQIMDSETRNSKHETDHDKVCDNSVSQTSNKSPDWSGPGWYRMKYPAGAMIPEELVEYDHCGTASSGYLSGDHPEFPGQQVERKVCFNSHVYNNKTDECIWETKIEIRNCGSFFLYNLPNTPGCYLRYCAE